MIFLVLSGGVIAVVAVDAWRIAKQNKQFVLSGLPVRTDDGNVSRKRTQPLSHENVVWRVSFDVPVEYAVAERVVSEDDEVEMELLKNVAEDTYIDTSVRVWVGEDTGFNRYLAKPYTTNGGYRRITAVARRAVTYSDPSREADAIQIIAVDDSRNGREVRVSYSALQEGAESLALSILETMRLGARDIGEDVLHKDGWRTFVYSPVRFQYPEDYAAERKPDGVITVRGAGGRIEIMPILDVLGAQTVTRTFAGKSKGDEKLPDDFFDLRYDVTLRVKIFYAGEDTYQKSVIQDISKTIVLKE